MVSPYERVSVDSSLTTAFTIWTVVLDGSGNMLGADRLNAHEVGDTADRRGRKSFSEGHCQHRCAGPE
jgi:hypothetical protein